MPIIFSFLAGVYTPYAGAGGADSLFREGVRLSRQGEYQKASRIFREVLDKDYSFTDAHLALGVALINMKRTGEAFYHIRKATELDSENTRALFILARLYEKNEETARAIETWERFLSLNPGRRHKNIAERHLNRLRRKYE